jgi:hypothetical protein
MMVVFPQSLITLEHFCSGIVAQLNASLQNATFNKLYDGLAVFPIL